MPKHAVVITHLLQKLTNLENRKSSQAAARVESKIKAWNARGSSSASRYYVSFVLGTENAE